MAIATQYLCFLVLVVLLFHPFGGKARPNRLASEDKAVSTEGSINNHGFLPKMLSREKILREVPSGPDRKRNPHSPNLKSHGVGQVPNESSTNDNGLAHILREVLSGPDPQHHDTPPAMKPAHGVAQDPEEESQSNGGSSSNENGLAHILRKVPSGPNPMHHDTPPAIKPHGVEESQSNGGSSSNDKGLAYILREVPSDHDTPPAMKPNRLDQDPKQYSSGQIPA